MNSWIFNWLFLCTKMWWLFQFIKFALNYIFCHLFQDFIAALLVIYYIFQKQLQNLLILHTFCKFLCKNIFFHNKIDSFCRRQGRFNWDLKDFKWILWCWVLYFQQYQCYKRTSIQTFQFSVRQNFFTSRVLNHWNSWMWFFCTYSRVFNLWDMGILKGLRPNLAVRNCYAISPSIIIIIIS